VRLFVAGDTHANARWVCEYLYPAAAELEADCIVQVGDFGYWEHEQPGVAFLDDIDRVAAQTQIPLYFLHGNHDRWSLIPERYQPSESGRYSIRPWIQYLPNGHVWTWSGFRMRVFGGAWSVDKDYRLDLEARRRQKIIWKNEWRRSVGHPEEPVPDTKGTLWFPEEEMSDNEMDELIMRDSSPMDVVFSHDMPHASDPGGPFKSLPNCLPNQRRLQRAMDVHRPTLWLHGHLHHRYTSHVYHEQADKTTLIVGLAADDHARERFWSPTDNWCLVDLEDGARPVFTAGSVAHEWVTAA
jgi:hypothetical protein